MKRLLMVRLGLSRAGDKTQLGSQFNRLWRATAASNLGDGILTGLLPLLAVSVTDRPAGVAAVTVAWTSAWLLFGLPGGLLVDARDRKAILGTVNSLRAAILCGLALAWAADQLSLPLLCAGALLLGGGEVLADTALTSIVPSVVPPDLRGKANARIEATINLLNQFGGPPVAGMLFAIGAALALGAAAGLYSLGALAILALRRRALETQHRVSLSAPWVEVWAGLRLLGNDRLLMRLSLLTAGMNIAWAIWTAIFVLYAVKPGPLGLSPTTFGLVLAAMAVGGFVITPFVDPMAKRIGVPMLLALDLIGTVTLVAPPALGAGVAPVVAGAVMAGAGATVWRAVVATIRQNRVEDRLLGRIYAAMRMISWGVLPVGAAAGGFLAQAAGVRAALGAASVLAFALVLAFPLAVRRFNLNEDYSGQHATAVQRT